MTGVPAGLGGVDGFSFHQLAFLLDRYFADAPPIGSAGEAGAERVRFRAHASLAFPPADIAGLDAVPRADGAELLRLTVAFLGLYGPTSPLPDSFTEQLLFDEDGSTTLREFYDLFNHRLVALLYRAWSKHRYYLRFRGTGQDEVSRAIFALIGLPRPDAPDSAEDGIRWDRLLPFAGLLALPSCPPGVLARVLAHYFDVPIRIEEGIERLVPVPDAQRHSLGRVGHSLGRDWTLGARVRDVSGRFRVWIGPISRQRFDGFAPGGPDHARLFALVRKLSRDSLDFEVRVLLEQGGVRPWHLGRTAPPLGWLLWLGKADAAGGGVPLRGAP